MYVLYQIRTNHVNGFIFAMIHNVYCDQYKSWNMNKELTAGRCTCILKITQGSEEGGIPWSTESSPSAAMRHLCNDPSAPSSCENMVFASGSNCALSTNSLRSSPSILKIKTGSFLYSVAMLNRYAGECLFRTWTSSLLQGWMN